MKTILLTIPAKSYVVGTYRERLLESFAHRPSGSDGRRSMAQAGHRPHPRSTSRRRLFELPWYAIRENYCQAVRNAGGLPILLPHDPDSASAISTIDGLIVTGGGF